MSETPTERDARLSLSWALRETCLRVPDKMTWNWRKHQEQLDARSEDLEFFFHVAVERHGARRFRIAVLKAYDRHGEATWEAPIPDGADGVEAPIND